MPKITLKAARVNCNLLQTDVAAKLGVSAKTVGNWETGASHPRAAQLVELCALYGVSLDDLILPK